LAGQSEYYFAFTAFFAKKLAYLHRGTKTLAFRLPQKRTLRKILAAVGPIAAPSANPEGAPPARNIAEARRYFGSKIDFYEKEGGQPYSKPSALIAFKKGRVVFLRK
jgi:L-threonylcarbamoyladenylate synthase